MRNGRSNGMVRMGALVVAMSVLSAVGQAQAPSVAEASCQSACGSAPSGSMFDKLTPSFSVAPRAIFRRRGPIGARIDRRESSSLWLSANLHDLLPSNVAHAWPAPVRLSVGRRAAVGPMGSEYAIGLDLDAARLPGNHPAWIQVKRLLHTVRLPGPAFVVSGTGKRMVGLYW